MRTLALALALVAAAGCNQIFGLQKTRPVDAAPDAPDAAIPHPVTIQLDYQLGTTNGSGAPAAAVTIPIAPAPTVMAGPLSGQLQLSDATYFASLPTASDAGPPGPPGIELPFDLAGQPWRLVFTAYGKPYEVQWSVKSAHLSLPQLQRPTDTTPPANTGYSITPSPVVSMVAPTLVTTGAFTNSPVPSNDRMPITGGTRIDYHYSSEAAPVLGTLGTPHGAAGDKLIVMDWHYSSASNPVIYDNDGYGITNAGELASPFESVTIPWQVPAAQTYLLNLPSITTESRLDSTALMQVGGTCCTFHVEYGMLYNANILPFVPQQMPFAGPQLDVPLFAPFYMYDDTATPPTSGITVVDPTSNELPFPRAVFATVSRPRSAYGVTVASALVELIPPAAAPAKAQLTFAAPLATQVTFAGVSLVDGGLADNAQVTKGTTPMILEWTPESVTPDDYVVTLFEIANNTLTPVHRYQVTQASVTIDPAVFTSGHRYGVSITARTGFPNISSSDYSAVTLPFSESTTFPAMFVVN